MGSNMGYICSILSVYITVHSDSYRDRFPYRFFILMIHCQISRIRIVAGPT